MTKKPIPEFKTDEEEARFWAEHDDEIEDYLGKPRPFDPALAEKLGLKAPPKTKPVSLRLEVNNLSRAKNLASKVGMPYQTLLNRLIGEGLDRVEHDLGEIEQRKRA